MHANFLFWTLPFGAGAFPAATPKGNNGASANIVQRANSAWLEVHTGVSVGLGGPTVGVLPGPVNKATCNLLVRLEFHKTDWIEETDTWGRSQTPITPDTTRMWRCLAKTRRLAPSAKNFLGTTASWVISKSSGPTICAVPLEGM